MCGRSQCAGPTKDTAIAVGHVVVVVLRVHFSGWFEGIQDPQPRRDVQASGDDGDGRGRSDFKHVQKVFHPGTKQ